MVVSVFAEGGSFAFEGGSAFGGRLVLEVLEPIRKGGRGWDAKTGRSRRQTRFAVTRGHCVSRQVSHQ